MERLSVLNLHGLTSGPPLHRIVAENLVELTYGRRTDNKGRDLVELNFYMMHIILGCMQGYIVDMIPARGWSSQVRPPELY